MKNTSSLNLFRIISLITVFTGMAGSLGFMFYAGRQNQSVILILLFTAWVSSPFLGLLIADFYNLWPGNRRKYLYFLMIFIAPISLLIYSGAFGIHGPHPAFVFMVVPFISWLLIGLIFLLLKRKM